MNSEALRSPAVRTALAATAIFVIALTARAVYLAKCGAWYAGDTMQYLQIADNLLAYDTFSLSPAPPLEPSIRYPPIYPVFLAASERLGLFDIGGIAALQTAVDALTAVLVFMIARAALPVAWAFGAALAYAFHPGPIPFSTAILTETVFTFLLTAAVTALTYGFWKDRLSLTALGGVLVGVATLCRAIALPLTLLAPCAALLVPGLERKRRHAALGVVFAILAVAPWCVRSSVLAGALVPVQSNGLVNFYAPSRPAWDQFRSSPDRSPEAEARERRDQDAYHQSLTKAKTLEEVAETDRVGLVSGIENIVSDPLPYLRMRARVYPYLIINSFDTFTGIHTPFGELIDSRDLPRLSIKLALLALFSLAPFALALVSLGRLRQNAATLACASIWLYTLLVHLPLWIEYRFWLPALPFLLVSAAVGARLLWERRHDLSPTARWKAWQNRA